MSIVHPEAPAAEAEARSSRRVAVPAAVRELGLIALAALAYAGVRAVTEGSERQALANAVRLMRLEERLGVAWELTLQELVLPYQAVVTAANWIYIWGHWPVITAVGILLYRHRRAHYRILRNAMFVSGGIGFAFFAALPLAPPRLADPAFVDTIMRDSSSYRVLQPPSVTNQFAALPSLHFGWNLLVGIVVVMATRRLVVRAFGVAMPVAMGLGVVVTANHYLIDVALGGAIVLLALALVTGAPRRPLTTLADGGRLALRAVLRRAQGGQPAVQPAGGGATSRRARRG